MKKFISIIFIFYSIFVYSQGTIYFSQNSEHFLVKTIIKQKLLNSTLLPYKSKRIYEKVVFTEIVTKIPKELWNVQDSVLNNMVKNKVYYIKYNDKLSFWVGLLESKTIYFKYTSNGFEKKEEDFLKTKSWFNPFVLNIIIQTLIFIFALILTKEFIEITSKVLLLFCVFILSVYFLWNFSELVNYIYVFVNIVNITTFFLYLLLFSEKTMNFILRQKPG